MKVYVKKIQSGASLIMHLGAASILMQADGSYHAVHKPDTDGYKDVALTEVESTRIKRAIETGASQSTMAGIIRETFGSYI